MTLENSKTYGLKDMEALRELSRTRLNAGTPHQVRAGMLVP